MASLTVGQVLAGHRVESVAGRGGMGVVYRATHLALNRVVALKLIAPELAEDPEFRRRFKRESETAASLDHTNVVPIYTAGEEEGLLYVTMRFVEGTDLREMITFRGRLEPREAARIVSQVASALDAAHGRGLVHRDIKPANVLIAGGHGTAHAYLTDFGLTKRASSQTGLTKTGMMVGTLDYIAPEQLQGAPVDARADVYALGCVLFEAITGEVPFPRDTEPAKMWAHMGEPPPTPSVVAGNLPAPFDDVVARAMAKAPDDRFLSAGDLGRATVAAAEGQLLSRAERSVATGDAAPDDATAVAAGSPTGATRLDAPPPGAAPAPPGVGPLGGVPPPPAPPAHRTLQPAPVGPTRGAAASPPTAPPGMPPGRQSGTPPPWGPPAPEKRSVLPFVLGGAVLGLLVIAAVVLLVARGGSGGGGGGAKAPAGVWVVTDGTEVSRLDPKTGRVLLKVREVGRKIVGIATGQGAVWAADERGSSVARIDPETNRVVARISTGGQTPNAIAVGEEGVFVAAGPSLIARIDPATNRIAQRETEEGAYDLATGMGFLWGANFLDDDVKRVDAEGLGVTGVRRGLGKEPRFIAVGEGAVWVLNSDGTLSRLAQPSGPGPPKGRKFEVSTSKFPGGLAVGEGAVWVAESNTLWRHDPTTGALAQTIDLGSDFVTNGIAVGGGYVWLTDFSDKEVVRVDVETRRVSPPVTLSGDTSRLAVGP